MPADTPIPVDLTAAREALARLDLPPCLARVPDEHPNDSCERPAGHDGPCRVTPDPIDKEHLRAALAEVDRLTAERTTHLLGVGHPMWLPSVADAVDHPDPFNATPSEVLDRVRAVVAERDELAATLANERGEGEPPVPGWTSCRSRYDDGSRNGTPRIEWYCNEGRVVRALNGWHWASCLHEDMVYHRGEFTRSGTAPTAREAIRLASDAARGAK